MQSFVMRGENGLALYLNKFMDRSERIRESYVSRVRTLLRLIMKNASARPTKRLYGLLEIRDRESERRASNRGMAIWGRLGIAIEDQQLEINSTEATPFVARNYPSDYPVDILVCDSIFYA